MKKIFRMMVISLTISSRLSYGAGVTENDREIALQECGKIEMLMIRWNDENRTLAACERLINAGQAQWLAAKDPYTKQTILHTAADCRCYKVLQFLVKNLDRIGLDINVADNTGLTVFGIIIRQHLVTEVDGEFDETLSLLLARGAIPTCNSLGVTLLKYQEALDGDQLYRNAALRVILLLIQYDASLDERDDVFTKSAREIAQEIFNSNPPSMKGLKRIVNKRFGKHCLAIPGYYFFLKRLIPSLPKDLTFLIREYLGDTSRIDITKATYSTIRAFVQSHGISCAK